MVLSWIQRSISESIVRSVLWFNRASDAWKDLQKRFSQGDVFHIADLQEDICKFQQGNLDISEFFTQLKVMWDELDTLRPPPRCCVRYNANVEHWIQFKLRERRTVKSIF